MSALILTSHIKEGVELAEKHRLGSRIIDIIRQHHGTSLITLFYRKARAAGDLETSEVDEKSFRYPGPRPQTKEAGLVMLADAIEAASKTLPEPTPVRIQWLTQKIVNKIFTDGQLDECELTLKDLHSITKSFNRVFAGIYHQRIDYPEPEELLKEDGVEGSGKVRGGERGPRGGGEVKKNDRDRLKRLGMQ
ncbi:MAG: HD domain-containing protein [Thermodesulfobacteriota bacterium]